MIELDNHTTGLLRFIFVILFLLFLVWHNNLSNEVALGVLIGIFFPNSWSSSIVKKKIREIVE